ncbi:Uncharacterised protein [Streptococcus pneumoniae]|nr:Uncharacterised protein [Streptococcus pneumoniae]
MNVVIYFKNGNTAYFGVSSQERKKATFYKDSIAGIARTQESADEQATKEKTP